MSLLRPLILATAALLLIKSPNGIAQAREPAHCERISYPVTGDLRQARLFQTGDAEFPCAIEAVAPAAARSSKGGLCFGCKGRPAPQPRGSAPIRLMTLMGSTPEDQELDRKVPHKTSFFGMALANGMELRLAVYNEAGATRLEVGVGAVRQQTFKPLGTASIDADRQFQVLIEENPNLNGAKVYFYSGTTRLAIPVPYRLGPEGIDGWTFGLLPDTHADNRVRYQLKLLPGPQPAVVDYGSP